jgi:hypothetical protein
MKKICLLLFAVVFVLLAACEASYERSIYDESDTVSDVTIMIKEERITKDTKELSFLLINESDNEYFYGVDPILEKKEKDEWYTIPVKKNVFWPAIAYMLMPESEKEETFEIETYYGSLEKGRYRIVKKLFSEGNEIIAIGEFEVD